MNLTKTIEINGAVGASISELTVFALENSQSQDFSILAKKKKLLEKLKSATEETILTTDEIQITKSSCLQTFKDGITLKIIEEIAPNDLG